METGIYNIRYRSKLKVSRRKCQIESNPTVHFEYKFDQINLHAFTELDTRHRDGYRLIVWDCAAAGK
jgi:hypothetical protein